MGVFSEHQHARGLAGWFQEAWRLVNGFEKMTTLSWGWAIRGRGGAVQGTSLVSGGEGRSASECLSICALLLSLPLGCTMSHPSASGIYTSASEFPSFSLPLFFFPLFGAI